MPTLEAQMKLGDAGPEVLALQEYLHTFGYLDLPDREVKKTNVKDAPVLPLAELGVFDDATLTGLAALQKRAGLAPTGELDEPTLILVETPRCGVPDPIEFVDADVHPFRIAARWGRTDLTYAFENMTPDLSSTAVRDAWDQATRLWADQCTLTFREVALGDSPDIRISFHRDDVLLHGFDGPGRILAHAWYPEDGGVHFDEAETWTVEDPPPPGQFDLVTVAAHELGHALGLDHSQERESIMWPTINGVQRSLAHDDIEAIQFLYGRRDRSPAAGLVRTPLRAAAGAGGAISVIVAASDAPATIVELRQTEPSSWPTHLELDIAGAPGITGAVAVASNRDGRLEVFGRGADQALWHAWHERPGGGWHSWESLGGSWTSDPSVAVNQDGRLEVFVRGTESALWQRNQLWPGGPFGPGFGALDGVITSGPSTVRLPDGRLQVFARGSNDAIWTRFQEAPGGGWRSWHQAANGTFASGPSVFVDGAGTVLVFATGLDGQPWVIWGRGGDSPWRGPIPHGPGRLADGAGIDAAINAVGGLELFARFDDDTLRHRWQVPAPAYWSDWHTLGGPIAGNPSVAKRAVDGRLEVFALQAPLIGPSPVPSIMRRAQTPTGWR